MRGALIAILAGALLAAAILAATVAYMPTAKGEPQLDEKQIRADCRADALWLCADIIARRCVPRETKGCRSAVVACMKSKRESLSAQCAQHLKTE